MPRVLHNPIPEQVCAHCYGKFTENDVTIRWRLRDYHAAVCAAAARDSLLTHHAT